MLYRAGDLSPEDEAFNIRSSRILKEAPQGEERAEAYRRYFSHLDALAERIDAIPEDLFDQVIDEACDHVRHSSSGS